MMFADIIAKAAPSIISGIIVVIIAFGGQIWLTQKRAAQEKQNKIVNHILAVCDSLEHLLIEYWSKPNDDSEQMQIINAKIEAHLKTLSSLVSLQAISSSSLTNKWQTLYRESTGEDFHQVRPTANRNKVQKSVLHIVNLRLEAMKSLPD